jgi:hypothetical protein
MSKSINLKKLAICSLTSAICGASPHVFAHTGIKDSATEGTTLYTAFAITHGCAADHDGPQSPVVAQSAVFPNGPAAVSVKVGVDPDGHDGPKTAPETPINLADHIDGAIGGLIGLSPGAIQDKSVFGAIREVINASEQVRAIHLTKGKLQTNLVGLTPFRVSTPNFLPDSCARSLQIRVAVANWCSTSQNRNDDTRVDVWIGRTTSKFNDKGVVSVGFWPTLTVTRDLTNNPLPEGCGDGFDIAVSPTDAQIDTFLPIQGYWPKP